jgi:hypothetical protein
MNGREAAERFVASHFNPFQRAGQPQLHIQIPANDAVSERPSRTSVLLES